MYLTEQEIMEQHIALNKTYDYMMEKKLRSKSSSRNIRPENLFSLAADQAICLQNPASS